MDHNPRYTTNNKPYIKKPYIKTNTNNNSNNRYNMNIDYKIKPWYYNWPLNEDDVRTASTEKLLGWWKCLPEPNNDKQLYLINLVVDECKYRYLSRTN